TYRELNTRSYQLARHLQTLGVEPDMPVGICVERSPALLIGLLGILKSGGAYLSLEPSHPAKRLAFMLEEADITVLLTEEKLVEKLPERQQARMVCLDSEWNTISQQSGLDPATRMSPKNLAYISYTSGSTGQPKGVCVIHQNVVRLVKNTSYAHFSADQTFLQLAPVAFDASTFEIWGCLLNGAKLVVMPPAPPSPADLGRVIVQHQVSTLWLTAGLFNLMVDERLEDLKPVRQLLAGGDVLSVPHIRKALEKLKDCRLINGYGPTENTTFTCCFPITEDSLAGASIPIGRPIANTKVYILDAGMRPVPIGVFGELYIGGDGMARGYLKSPDLTAEKFVPNPFSKLGVSPDNKGTDTLEAGEVLYKTGDMVRYLSDGNIEFLGRIDNQVKIRGFRIELAEIEAEITQYPAVRENVVVVCHAQSGDKRLVAYLVPEQAQSAETTELRHFLTTKLPDYMVPQTFVWLEAMSLTPNGKVDRRALPDIDSTRQLPESTLILPQTKAEQRIAAIWKKLLELEEVGIYDNFFELGGHSLLMARMQGELQTVFDQPVSLVKLFQYPTINSLAKHLTLDDTQKSTGVLETTETAPDFEDIAIIGMSGRFPGARDVDAFWQNLRDGVESITFFTEEELLAEGIDSASLDDPNYVKANGILEDIELFDTAYFGYSPGEAKILDPQQRLFLECAVGAIENAGYDVYRNKGQVGVFAGIGMSHYFLNHIFPNRPIIESVGEFPLLLANDKDFLSTRTSYKLNLKGPSINVQTACSTSLVAIHLACQSLRNSECEIALAGGVSIQTPQKAGYLYQPDMIVSPDGHCRAFDAKAQGTISGNGIGIVVLKKLDKALADGDYIHAVIKGTAINNDGALKVGYTAPSVDGQTAAIAGAMRNVDPETITYIETHGTGTTMGDPIEIAALTQAYQQRTRKKGFCAIGAVKSNVGHLNVAAGVAGLIKSVLSLKHKMLPPSLHFEQPNPKIDFANSPFFVNNTLSEWKSDGAHPRRCGVSAFGLGGTNAHIVLEEAPAREPASAGRAYQLITLSAKTDTALKAAAVNLAGHLKEHPDLNFADVAYTLQVGRQTFRHRGMVVCREANEAVKVLETFDPKRINIYTSEPRERPIAFLFPGLGDHYVNMAKGLYRNEKIFREQIDFCCDRLKPMLGIDLRELLYPAKETGSTKENESVKENEPAAAKPLFDLRKMLAPRTESGDATTQKLNQTIFTQPAVFVVEYALARLWMSWGVKPQAMIGYSVGEYVAACISGVITLEDALCLVAERAKMIDKLPSGSMLAVPLSEEEILPLLTEKLSVSIISTPKQCVVSGLPKAVEEFEIILKEKNIICRRLQTSHAFHSWMMDGCSEQFEELMAGIPLKPPAIPYVSNVTGTWITEEQAVDPHYWVRHTSQTVRFADGIGALLQTPDWILLEVGPGRSLGSFVLQHPAFQKIEERVMLSSLRHMNEQQEDEAFLLNILGQLWLAGIQIRTSSFYGEEIRYRLPLPTYPFERQRYWIEPSTETAIRETSASADSKTKNPDIADWFYLPSWKRSVLETPVLKTSEPHRYLVLTDEYGLADPLVRRLEQLGHEAITVRMGTAFTQSGERAYVLNHQSSGDYEALFKELSSLGKMPHKIIHLWTVTQNDSPGDTEREEIEKNQALGFYSLLFITKALGKINFTDELQLVAVSNRLLAVTETETLCTGKATLLGPLKVIGQEYPNIHCRSIDIVISSPEETEVIDSLLMEITNKHAERVIAYRGRQRWVQIFEPVRLPDPAEEIAPLKEGGVYLITGGLGKFGLVMAEYLAKTVRAKLVLAGRSTFIPPNEWEDWLATHDELDESSLKIKKLQAIKELGAEVLITRADAANLQQMQETVTMAEERFGQINGVIHAAGVVDRSSFTSIEESQKTHCERQFQSKVYGTLVLEKVLKKKTPDFCFLMSSLSSVLGGLGFVAYSAANIFMDAFAYQQNRVQNSVAWQCVNWDGWQFEDITEQNSAKESTVAEFTFQVDEGINALRRVLSYPHLTQLVVSTGDLQTRIRQWILFESKQEESDGGKKDSTTRYARYLTTPYVAPRNEREQKLADIWQTLLGIEQVGIYDNYFDLGGHSLLAVRLVGQIGQQFGVHVPVSMLLEGQTIEKLALLLDVQTTSTWSSLAPIQPKGSKPPFFCIPGLGGNVIYLYELARSLGIEQPFYGLQAVGFDGEAEPHASIEEMATHYTREIQTIQPQGPYLLGGHSFGAKVAYEMVQQLKKQGLEVAQLVIFDTISPQHSNEPIGVGWDETQWLMAAAEVVADWLEEPLEISETVLQSLEPPEQLNYFHEQLKQVNLFPLDSDIKKVRGFIDVYKANIQMHHHYVPLSINSTRISLFKADIENSQESLSEKLYEIQCQPTWGWSQLSEIPVTIHIVPGNHITMFNSPHVQVLAEQLKACIEEALGNENE
ncbi:MAG: amino acid adenylation domain-containing protein, partial [Planctomycetes bacterium]|nr:amino acid adenylation domain-containing protein [Planctomycetota bacterium]